VCFFSHLLTVMSLHDTMWRQINAFFYTLNLITTSQRNTKTKHEPSPMAQFHNLPTT